MPTFRFQGRSALLTYSRVGDFFTAYAFAVEVVEFIRPRATDNYLWKWAVEAHEEINPTRDEYMAEGWHVHVFIDLGKTNSERGHIFDFGGHHPNIKLCGGKTQRKNQLRYLEKDGFWKSNEEELVEAGITGVEKDDVYGRALEATTYKDFTDIIMEGAAEDFVRSYINIRACGQDRYRKEARKWTSTRTLADFQNVPQLMVDYANYINSEEEIERPKTLIVISDTRYGKTQWARSITADHAYMSTEWNPDQIDDEKRLLIFDDVPMSELLPRQRWKAFFGMQQEFDITGKYRGSRHVLRSWKGFVFCCNVDPRYEENVTEAQRNYITANSIIVELQTPLYNNA